MWQSKIALVVREADTCRPRSWFEQLCGFELVGSLSFITYDYFVRCTGEIFASSPRPIVSK